MPTLSSTMLINDNKRDSHWGIQVAIAKAVARMPNPSLMELHHNILEEFGFKPSLELVDFFIEIVNLSEEKEEEYLRYTGTKKKKHNTGEKEPHWLLADIVALGNNPTVLKFRQRYLAEYNETPSEELISYFLLKIQSIPQKNKVNENKDDIFHFAKMIASSSQVTVLKFRQEFSRRYGASPSDNLTKYFLKKMQKYNSLQSEDKDFSAQIHFAKTVANGVNPTILQFRKAFEKAYGEVPSTKLTEIFIKNIS